MNPAVHESIDAEPLMNVKKAFSPDNIFIHPELYFERLQEFESKFAELDQLRTGKGGNVNLYIGLLLKSSVSGRINK